MKPYVDIILVSPTNNTNSRREMQWYLEKNKTESVPDELVCPDGYEPLISRLWPGTKEICLGGKDAKKDE